LQLIVCTQLVDDFIESNVSSFDQLQLVVGVIMFEGLWELRSIGNVLVIVLFALLEAVHHLFGLSLEIRAELKVLFLVTLVHSWSISA